MKTPKYHQGNIQITRSIIILFGLIISFLWIANATGGNPSDKSFFCVFCKNSVSANQNGVLSEDMSWLAPTTPSEAPFSNEIAETESNLAQTSPEEASFEGDTELINSSAMEFLAPATPQEADFKD